MESVDETPDAERIEIELTSNAEAEAVDRPPHRHSRPPIADPAVSGEGVVVGPSDGDPQRPASEQVRLVATAAVVGVVALLLGWLIGYSSSSDEVATTSATTPVTTERVLTSLLPGETLPSASTTTTRPPRTTTTTTIPPATPHTVVVDPRLEGVELTLVGLRQGALEELDLTARTIVSREFGPFPADPGSFVVGDDWVVLTGSMAGTQLVVYDDGSSEHVELGDWQVMWQVGTDRFWRPSISDDWHRPNRFEEVDLAGLSTGAVIDLPIGSWAWQADPRGGLIVQAAGNLYQVDESSVSAIGSGDLIAISDQLVLTWNCDALLRCGVVVMDRPTGETRRLDLADPDGQPLDLESLFGWGVSGSSMISPDGAMSVVLLQSNDGPAHLALIDLESGAVVELGSISYIPTVAWSADGRLVFFLEGGDDSWFGGGGRDLMAYDRESGEVFPALAEPVEWDALSARPVSG
jgi:hypothetical protein